MNQIRTCLLTKKSGIRHLVMLGITILALLWTYSVLALLQNEWSWGLRLVSKELTWREKLSAWCLVAVIFSACGLTSIPIYWNARVWMGPWLLKSFFCFIGMIPILNRLIPELFRSSGWEEAGLINASTEIAYDDDGMPFELNTPMIIAIPLGFIKAVVRGTVMSALYLVGAIIIPVCSPVVAIVAAWGISELAAKSMVAAVAVSTVVFLLFVCLLVVHPVLSLAKKD